MIRIICIFIRNNNNLKEILINLNPKLKIELKYEIYKNLIYKLDFFKTKSKEFVSVLAPLLKSLFIKKDKFIFEINEPAEEIYFIKKGKVSILSSINKVEIYTYFKGNYFGEWDFIYNNNIRKYYALAKENCELLILTKNDFENKIIKRFIKEKNEIYSKARLRNFNLKLNQKESKKNKNFINKRKSFIKKSGNSTKNYWEKIKKKIFSENFKKEKKINSIYNKIDQLNIKFNILNKNIKFRNIKKNKSKKLLEKEIQTNFNILSDNKNNYISDLNLKNENFILEKIIKNINLFY